MSILDNHRTSPSGDDLLDAADALSAFIDEAAARTADEIGFGYVLLPDAPHTFGALAEAYAVSARTGTPLPISSENSDDVIYGTPKTNGALRFWHDVNHVRRQLNFGLVYELELSRWHLGELEKAGHPGGSLVWRLLHADLTGQVYVKVFARRFPADQRRFAAGCISAGFDDGLLAELRRGNRP